MGNFTVVLESSAIGCHVVHPIREKRVPEVVIGSFQFLILGIRPNTFITITVT